MWLTAVGTKKELHVWCALPILSYISVSQALVFCKTLMDQMVFSG